MKIEIGDIERIRLEPGDRIAVKVPDRLSQDAAERIRNMVSARLGVSVDRVLVLGGGISLAVVTP